MTLKITLLFTIFAILPKMAYSDPTRSLNTFAFSNSWLKALHYERSGNDFESRVDHPPFFLSPSGKTDPLAELTAFIRAYTKNQTLHNMDLACALPYRTSIVLKAGLVDFKPIKCDAFEFYKYETGSDQISMVFVGQYADDPASILGHLFLKFESKERSIGSEGVAYLDKSFNYAAGIPEDTNILKYISYGIFGGFEGKYSQIEYSDLVEKYSNMESRDVYIYPLDLSESQKNDIVAHSWELITLASHDYYFFDENCAFQLLALIDISLTDQSLVSELPFYTAPVDVLKILAEHQLISKHTFNPSLYLRMHDMIEAMNSTELSDYSDILKGRRHASSSQSALVQEALIETINYRKHKSRGKMTKAEKDTLAGSLSERSKLGTSVPKVEATQKTSPHLSHGSSRLALGAKTNEHRKGAYLSFRPAFHDLLSPTAGYEPSSNVEVLSFALWAADKELILDRITVFKLSKFKGARVLEDLAWSMDVSAQSHNDCSICLRGDTDIEFGWSRDWRAAHSNLLFLVSGNAGQKYYTNDRSWGLGFRLGWLWYPTDSIRTIISLRALNSGRGSTYQSVSFEAQKDMTEILDLRLKLQNSLIRKEDIKDYWLTLGLSF